MFNKLINYIKDYNSIVSISSDFIYIYNYVEIDNFKDNVVSLKLTDKYIEIEGSDFVIEKMEEKEIYIKGNVKKISYK